jgi:molybdopterin-containing oxidoreductase family iron-sulfur binding subunit
MSDDAPPEQGEQPGASPPAEAPADPERRSFVCGLAKAAAVGGLAMAAGQGALSALGEHVGGHAGHHPDTRFVMVIDLAKCDGCKKCTEACSKEHFVPQGQEWIKVYSVDDGFGGTYNLPRLCMMCENPPCRNVCPTGATFVNSEGLTLVDHTICIGCRYCLAACPYSARYFNWTEPPHTDEELNHTYSVDAPWPHRKGVAEKCMWCVHRRHEGKLPACVEGCAMGAIYFGDAAEDAVTNGLAETLPLRRTLSENAAYTLREDLGTGPGVYYLPRRR